MVASPIRAVAIALVASAILALIILQGWRAGQAAQQLGRIGRTIVAGERLGDLSGVLAKSRITQNAVDGRSQVLLGAALRRQA